MPNLEEFAKPLLFALGSGVIAYLIGRAIARRSFFNTRYLQQLSASRWIDVLAYGFIFAFLVAFFVIGLRKLETLSFYGVDFAFFDQAIWNSLNGRLLQETTYLDSSTILGHHFSPILLALVPVYAVVRNPQALAVLPAVTISLSAVPLYWFARTVIARPLALVLLIAYFLAPVVEFAGVSQFYELDLAVPLLSLALLFLLRHRTVPFLICLGLALLVKEELAIVTLGFGLYIMIIQRRVLLGVGLTVFSVFYLVLLLQIVLPHFQGGSIYYFFGGSQGQGGNNVYSYLGSNLAEIVRGVFTKPNVVLQQLTLPAKLEALLRLFVPAGLVPLAGAEVSLLAAPVLGYILLSDAPWIYTFGSWHYAVVIPFVFFGLVVAVQRLSNWRPRRQRNAEGANASPHRFAIQIALGAICLASSMSYFTLTLPNQPGSDFALLTNYAVSQHTELGRAVAQMVPSDAVLIAQTELAPYVSERKELYLDMSAPCLGKADYVFVDKERPWYGYLKERWDSILASDLFSRVTEQDGYVLEKRAAPNQTVNAQFGDSLRLLGYSLNGGGNVTGGQSLRPIIQWQKLNDFRTRDVIAVGVEDAEGHEWATSEMEPGGGFCPTDQLDRDQVLSDQYDLRLPPTMPAGDYRLLVSVEDKVSGQYLLARNAAGATESSDVQLATVHVIKDKSSHTANELTIERPLFVDMDEMRFLGYVQPTETIRAGDVLSVGTFWRARGKPLGDYEMAVQLWNSEGSLAFEQASRPAHDTYPTIEWQAGEVLLDWHELALPQNFTDGEYRLTVVLRNAITHQPVGEVALSSLAVTQ